MKPDLIIITRQFPYGNSETFLESEILVICSFFNTITIYPSTNHEIIRELPTNVFVNNLICNDYVNKVKWGIRTVFTYTFYKKILNNFYKIRNRNGFISFIKYCISYTIYKNKANILLSDNSANLIYSYWYNAFVDAFCDINKPGKKIFTRVHRGDLYEEFTKLGFFPDRKLSIDKIDTIFSISNHGLDYLINKFNINNIIVSRLGVVDKKIIAKCSSNLNFSIVSVSNIIPVKNVLLIAKSIKHFALENPNITVKWNHFGDGEEMIEVKKIIFNENLNNLNCFLHGRVNNAKILEFYSKNAIDLFINLSSSEGIPVSIMEAISFGIPIIATDVGGVSEIVNATVGVLLKDQSSAEFISKEILKLFKYPKDRTVIRGFWLANYSARENYTCFAKKLIEEC
ncbi:MAG: glycosyltransferase [Bacteroidota bacterium]